MWQQVESYRHGMYAGAAFRRPIEQRARQETEFRLATEGYSCQKPDSERLLSWDGWNELSEERRREIWEEELSESADEQFDRRRWIRRRGKQVFEQLQQMTNSDVRRFPAEEAKTELTGYEGHWEPPHNRMLMARHETSRSRGARLIDNVFGRIKEMVKSGDANSGGLRRRNR